MQIFVRKPDLEMQVGLVVDKETTFEYENETVRQSLRDLVFRSVTKVRGEGYESEYHTTIYLKTGDVLIYEEEGRGYIKPVEQFVTAKEAIEDLESIQDL